MRAALNRSSSISQATMGRARRSASASVVVLSFKRFMGWFATGSASPPNRPQRPVMAANSDRITET